MDEIEPFSLNEGIVWDSGFGYEIGYFLGEGNQYGTYLVKIITAAPPIGQCSFPTSQIHRYTCELIDELTKRYGYRRDFTDEI